jgi:hypothetical protein
MMDSEMGSSKISSGVGMTEIVFVLKIVFVATKKGGVRRAAQVTFGKPHRRFDTRKKYAASGGNREKQPFGERKTQVAPVELRKTTVDRKRAGRRF